LLPKLIKYNVDALQPFAFAPQARASSLPQIILFFPQFVPIFY
jgi:hypothetical protein